MGKLFEHHRKTIGTWENYRKIHDVIWDLPFGNRKLWKITIEIVDLPLQDVDFP